MNTEPLSVPPLRFKVAFSYPGELRPLVEKVARLVANKCGEEHVLYDRFHEAEFARFHLDVHLPGLYRTESALIVVFLCGEYLQKEWCKLEFSHIRELANTLESERVMLLSSGQIDLAVLGLQKGGLFRTDSQSPHAIAKKILERLEFEKTRNPNFLYKRMPSSRNLGSAPQLKPTLPSVDDRNHVDTLSPIATQSEKPPVVAPPPAVAGSAAASQHMTRPSPDASSDSGVTIPSPLPRRGLGRRMRFAVATIAVLGLGAGGIRLIRKHGEAPPVAAPRRHELPAQGFAVATASTQPLPSSPAQAPPLAASPGPDSGTMPRAATSDHTKTHKHEAPKHSVNTDTGAQRSPSIVVKKLKCILDAKTGVETEDGWRVQLCVDKGVLGVHVAAASGDEHWTCTCR